MSPPVKNPRFLTDMSDPRHGSVNGYVNLECRCNQCQAANARRHRRYMIANPEQREKRKLRMKKWRLAKKRGASSGI